MYRPVVATLAWPKSSRMTVTSVPDCSSATAQPWRRTCGVIRLCESAGRSFAATAASCFRRMKQTGLELRPMFHWTARRIEAHVKLCVLALQMQRSAEIRTGLPWARIAHALGALKALRYRSESRLLQTTDFAYGFNACVS